MVRLAKHLWHDQAGFIVSAELVLISTVGVIGLVTGLTCLRDAVNSELSDVACAISSLDQSYCYTGFHSYKDKCSCVTKAWTAGSTNVYTEYETAYETEYETELLPIEDVGPQPIREHAEGVIISEEVISERIISERPIEEPTPCETCPAKTEVTPQPATPAGTPTPSAAQPTPVETPAPAPTPMPTARS